MFREVFDLRKEGDGWSYDEDKILTELYPYGDKKDILEKIPRRSWEACYNRGSILKVRRRIRPRPKKAKPASVKRKRVFSEEEEMFIFMEIEHKSRKDLADFIGCTPHYVSKYIHESMPKQGFNDPLFMIRKGQLTLKMREEFGIPGGV